MTQLSPLHAVGEENQSSLYFLWLCQHLKQKIKTTFLLGTCCDLFMYSWWSLDRTVGTVTMEKSIPKCAILHHNSNSGFKMIIMSSSSVSFVALVAKCKRNINQCSVQYIYVFHSYQAFGFKKGFPHMIFQWNKTWTWPKRIYSS